MCSYSPILSFQMGEVSKKGWSDLSSFWGQGKRNDYEQPSEDSGLLHQG